MKNEFGGDWTQKKLAALKKYLMAYEKIFTSGKARYYTRTYVDAFAGTGTVYLQGEGLDDDESIEREAYIQGSASVALDLPVGFDRYLFIEKDPAMAAELESLKTQFPSRAELITIQTGDANERLVEWCHNTDWEKNRAIVFLDPFGMQVDWETIKVIALTQGIDLWLLFPLGQAVMRMLTNSGVPPEEWAQKLTRFFGADDWKEAFYKTKSVDTLFGAEERSIKTARFKDIENYFLEKLRAIFHGVAKPMVLSNSTGSPLYLLCFAASNPRGAPIAIKIANHILGGKTT
jgi:three-Cys-motif partner protein